ncbi:hypothetical protein ON010_g10666 [Phytophthora cinnamomi]|nr:hypothetical protein ON010_g10666 [Phytophthora cinnamomi]
MFVRLANGLCPRDESANGLNSLAGIPVASLFRGTVCKPSGGFGPSQITSEGSASSNESDWKDDLKFIIPVGVFIFLLGCAGLIYLYRQQKKLSAQETHKEVEKDDNGRIAQTIQVNRTSEAVNPQTIKEGYLSLDTTTKATRHHNEVPEADWSKLMSVYRTVEVHVGG